MARQFGNYSPAVPLGVTWEESLLLEDADGAPVDLTGYSVRAQLRVAVPGRTQGEPTSAPVLELTSAGYYVGTPPAWPVVEGLVINNPADGEILLAVAVDDVWRLSPDNTRRRLVWSVVLVNPATQYAIPVIQGVVPVLPATTL